MHALTDKSALSAALAWLSAFAFLAARSDFANAEWSDRLVAVCESDCVVSLLDNAEFAPCALGSRFGSSSLDPWKLHVARDGDGMQLGLAGEIGWQSPGRIESPSEKPRTQASSDEHSNESFRETRMRPQPSSSGGSSASVVGALPLSVGDVPSDTPVSWLSSDRSERLPAGFASRYFRPPRQQPPPT